MTIDNKIEAKGFEHLGIAPSILEVLKKLGFNEPTPIQRQSIPTSLQGKDLVGIAQTGTGKTLAFGVPMIERIARHKGRGLVVLPTRELALQVDENLKLVGSSLGLRTAVLIGGESIVKQHKALKNKPHIIVATPGRLIDHAESGTVSLSDVRVLILDEADMMLDMGFLPQIKRILKLVPEERQTMLFSATMPAEIASIATGYMKMPVRIEVAPAGTSAENVEQELIVVAKEEKFEQLKSILPANQETTLIFLRTKHAVKTLTSKINKLGFKAAEIHSNRSQAQRQLALQGFKDGKYNILVATDIAARGIDVSGIGLVINYDLPEKTGDYVHRIGRTGRAGKSGRAVSFVTPSQIKTVREIEKLINKTLPINKTKAELDELSRFAAIDDKVQKVIAKSSRGRGAGRRPSQGAYRGASAAAAPNARPAYRGGSIISRPTADRQGPAKQSQNAQNRKPMQGKRENVKRDKQRNDKKADEILFLSGLDDLFPTSSDPLAPSPRTQRRPERRNDRPAQKQNNNPSSLSSLTDKERFRRSMRVGR